MVSKSHAKRRQDIKTKLMAAIAMLLVSSIMMVSSTYAWFTLSTAPEVTGISTSVGANGNLEMALLPSAADLTNVTGAFGIGSEQGDGNKTLVEKNITWGNLVDLSDAGYGLSNITLYPSQINIADNGISTTAFLKIPEYGADGRVTVLSDETLTGVFSNGAFKANDRAYGVRAIGTSTGMSERQYSFRNSLATAYGAFGTAKASVSTSLNENGPVVGQIAIKHAGNAGAKHSYEEVQSIDKMVTDIETVIGQIEEGYKYYLLVYAASSLNDQTDAAASDAKWLAVKSLVEANGSTLTSVVSALEGQSVTIDSTLGTYISNLAATKTDVATARTNVNALLAKGEDYEYSWNEITGALNVLINTSQLKVNGYDLDEVTNHVGDLMGGLTISVLKESGVYSEIADHVGGYKASFHMDAQYNEINVTNVPVTMEVSGSTAIGSGDALYAAVSDKAPTNTTSDEEATLSEQYGYIIDLAFRTNAAESNLQLQTTPVDRIYGDNQNPETMGHGSTVTFSTTDSKFTAEKMKDLMENIRIVFFDPTNGEIFANASIDTRNATVSGSSVTASIRLTGGVSVDYNKLETGAAYDASSKYFTVSYTFKSLMGIADSFNDLLAGGNLWVEDTEDAGNYVTVEAGETYDSTKTYYERVAKYTEWKPSTEEGAAEVSAQFAEAITSGLYIQVTSNNAANSFLEGDANTIVSLDQNVAKAVSVLVYLDGTTITNADVSATALQSMVGTLNLQFSSSANLQPMEYADLHQPANKENEGEGEGEGTT